MNKHFIIYLIYIIFLSTFFESYSESTYNKNYEYNELFPQTFALFKLDVENVKSFTFNVKCYDPINGANLNVFIINHLQYNQLINQDYYNNNNRTIFQDILGNYVYNGNLTLLFDSYETKIRNNTSKLDYISSQNYEISQLLNATFLSNIYNISINDFKTFSLNQLNIIKNLTNFQIGLSFILSNHYFYGSQPSIELKEYANVYPFYVFLINSDMKHPIFNISLEAIYVYNEESKVKFYIEVITSSTFWGLIGLSFGVSSILLFLFSLIFCCQSPGNIYQTKIDEDTTYFQHIRNNPKLHLFLYFIHFLMYLTDNNFITSICFRSKRSKHKEPVNSLSRAFIAVTLFSICSICLLSVQLIYFFSAPSDCMVSYECEKKFCNYFEYKVNELNIQFSTEDLEKLKQRYKCEFFNNLHIIEGEPYKINMLYALKSHEYFTEKSLKNASITVLDKYFWDEFNENQDLNNCLTSFCFEKCKVNLLTMGQQNPLVIEDNREYCEPTSIPFETRFRLCKSEEISCDNYSRVFMALPWLAMASTIICAIGILFKSLFYIFLKKIFKYSSKTMGKLIITVLSFWMALISFSILLIYISVLLIVSPKNPFFVTLMQTLFSLGIAFITIFTCGSMLMILYYSATFKWRKMYIEMRKEFFYSRDKERSNIENMNQFDFSISLCMDYIDCNGRIVLIEENQVQEPKQEIVFKSWIQSPQQVQGKKSKKDTLKIDSIKNVDKITVAPKT